MSKPHEETWKRKGHDVVASPGGRVLTAVRLYPYDAASLDLASAAPDMARALLEVLCADGHTPDCGGSDGGDECSSRCVKVRAALQKAGVPLP